MLDITSILLFLFCSVAIKGECVLPPNSIFFHLWMPRMTCFYCRATSHLDCGNLSGLVFMCSLANSGVKMRAGGCNSWGWHKAAEPNVVMQLQWTTALCYQIWLRPFSSGSISIDLLFGSKNEVWEDGRTGSSFSCIDQLSGCASMACFSSK